MPITAAPLALASLMSATTVSRLALARPVTRHTGMPRDLALRRGHVHGATGYQQFSKIEALPGIAGPAFKHDHARLGRAQKGIRRAARQSSQSVFQGGLLSQREGAHPALPVCFSQLR
jgi:hypothetical protein